MANSPAPRRLAPVAVMACVFSGAIVGCGGGDTPRDDANRGTAGAPAPAVDDRPPPPPPLRRPPP